MSSWSAVGLGWRTAEATISVGATPPRRDLGVFFGGEVGDETAADDLVGRRVENGDQFLDRFAGGVTVRVEVVLLVVVAEPSTTSDGSLEEVEDVGARELGVATLQRLGKPVRVERVELSLELVIGGDAADRVAEVVAPHLHNRGGRRGSGEQTPYGARRRPPR
jgi:hypothetical protein